MSTQKTPPAQSATPPRGFLSHLRRPRLFAGTTTGIVVYLVLIFFPAIPGRMRFILSWDIGVIVALTLMLFTLRHVPPERIRTIAARQVVGKWTVLGLTVVAATASLVVIAAEVPLIKTAEHVEQMLRLALVLVTIVLSWALIHTIFALHYAHDYYLGASGKAECVQGGIVFPGDRPPAYGDFVYFSFTIGMTFQVSDTQIVDPAVRQLAVTHGIISFFYSTGILALTINLVAGLL